MYVLNQLLPFYITRQLSTWASCTLLSMYLLQSFVVTAMPLRQINFASYDTNNSMHPVSAIQTLNNVDYLDFSTPSCSCCCIPSFPRVHFLQTCNVKIHIAHSQRFSMRRIHMGSPLFNSIMCFSMEMNNRIGPLGW